MAGKRQQGAALLMVMVVLAMLAAGMAWLVEDGRRQVDEVQLLRQRVQVRAMEQAGLAYYGIGRGRSLASTPVEQTAPLRPAAIA